jgi:AICAR transformylase/IMP cyclohydrolase PurH
LRDAEVITTAENAGIPMVLTKIRHFRHWAYFIQNKLFS